MNASAPDLNITFELIEHASSAPERSALALPGRDLSYRELDRLAWHGAQHLHDQGVRPGDVVALTFTDQFRLALAMLGVARLGATALSIPRNATPFQRLEWARIARCRLLVSDAPQRFDTGVPAVVFGPDELRGPRRIDRGILDEHPHAPCSIVVGSGSTGRPKLIPITHAQMRARCRLAAVSPATGPDSRSVYLPPLEFAAIQTAFLCVLHLGACFVFIDAGQKDLIDFCARRSVTAMTLTVFHAEHLLRALPQADKPHFHFLEALRIGGSTVTDDLRARILDRLSENLIIAYGANECVPVSLAVPEQVRSTPGTVGTPLPGVQVQIVDGEGNPLPQGAIGLIRARSPAMVDGYLDDEEATRGAFVDGWFHPGDLGRFSPDGQLIHCGRADQMMIMNGINIYPAEIEQCLSGHPAVRDAAAMPLKHPVHQDVPVCAVSLVEGARANGEDLLAYARERLGTRSPGAVIVLPRIPRNEMGKVVRAELAREIAQALGLQADR